MSMKKSTLGKSLVKDRFKGRRHRSTGDGSGRHAADMEDGYDWNKINLRSVTEESSIDEFLTTAQLAGTEFAAEKLNITFVNPSGQIGVPTAEEKKAIEQLHRENIALLQIPRRPPWTATTSAAELHAAEEAAFLQWRRQLALLQEDQGLTLTPYERNLEFWRQLWRVVERSDVVVQILDARNPLLYRCEDLERYVREVNVEKDNLLLINKSDFLTAEQRLTWAEYFTDHGIKAVFFSALNEADPPKTTASREETIEEEDEEEYDEDEKVSDGEDDESEEDSGDKSQESKSEDTPPTLQSWPESPSPEPTSEPSSTETPHTGSERTPESPPDNSPPRFNTGKLLSRDELIALLKTVHEGEKYTEGQTTIGFVGYPNVGKSSTINALLQAKRVSVSATPGKTKHFQTLHIDSELMLCDCPGLVMPSFLSSKAEMVVWGVLPIDQMRDHVGPINQVAHLIPRAVLENTYGLMLPKPREGEPQDRPPTSEELCNAYGYMRGFMTARGMPDRPRSARVILKDFVKGKLLYCLAPPEVDQVQFHTWDHAAPRERPADARPPQERMIKPDLPSARAVEETFFKEIRSKAHSKDVRRVARVDGVKQKPAELDDELPDRGDAASIASSISKPWKSKSGGKRPKKEKLRRLYRHLDDV